MGGIEQAVAEITKHGYLLLFIWVAAEQLGAPLPAVPILIAGGVLSAGGHLSFPATLLLGIVACLIGDIIWYVIGKKRGMSVLRLLCKISLEPETCVRQSSDFLSRHGGGSLLVAKFIPGVSTVAVPLAANSGVAAVPFLAWDIAGSFLYVGSYLAIGLVLGDRLGKLSALADSMKLASAGLVVFATASIVGLRVQQRRRFQKEVEMARISPEQVRALIENREAPFIVDLRHPLDMLTDPQVLPGAFRVSPDELSARHEELPRDREIILYCT